MHYLNMFNIYNDITNNFLYHLQNIHHYTHMKEQLLYLNY